MSRRKRAIQRDIQPDSEYQNIVVSKFINYVMRRGKKGLAETIVYRSLDSLQSRVKAVVSQEGKKSEQDVVSSDLLGPFFQVLDNVKPKLEVKSRRVGGSTYQIPVEVRDDRQVYLALRWIVKAAKARSGRSMTEKLAAELFDAYNNRGDAVKKKEDVHKMAEANRAFAHYIW